MIGRCGAALALIACAAAPVSAQARAARWEIAPGAVWSAGMDLGGSAATLERPGGGSFELFKTDTRLDGAIGAAVTLSFLASPRLALEAGFSYARPGVSTRITDDTEGAVPVTATIGLQQYLVEGSLRWYPGRARGAWRPFVRAGGGYLRELDDASAHVENGTAVHAGAGVDRAVRERAAGRLKRFGVRAEARVLGRTGGFDVDDAVRPGLSAGALLFFGF